MRPGWRNEAGEVDPHRIAHDLEQLGKAWADMEHAAKLLAGTKGEVFAQLVLKAMDGGMSEARAKLAAKGSEEWLDHVYAMLDARHKANLAKITFDAATAEFEALRTAEATRRAEMRQYGRT